MASLSCFESLDRLRQCTASFSDVELGAIAAALAFVGFIFGAILFPSRRTSKQSVESSIPADEKMSAIRHELQEAQQRLHNLQNNSSSGEGQVQFQALLRTICNEESVWFRKPNTSVVNYQERMAASIPIVMFASNAGGAGKTTLCGGMAGYFTQKGERVLVIDLDANASLSAQMRGQVGQGISIGQEMSPGNTRILGRSLEGSWAGATILDADEYLDYVTSSPSFAEFERCLELRWMLDQTVDDARFRLARTLLSEHVQSNYDRVILDCSSHIGMGFINGLFAATHIFVPTRMDRLSIGSLLDFVRFYSKLKSETNFAGEFSGAIGTMMQNREAINRLDTQRETNTKIEEMTPAEGSNHFLRGGYMPFYPKMSQSSARGLPYLTDPGTHAFFDPLGNAIKERTQKKVDA